MRILILVGLVKLLIETENPLLCSGIYAGVVVLFALMGGGPPFAVLIYGVFRFALASAYFWLIQRYSMTSGMWWAVIVGGIVIGIV